jgi:hypothetical protein
MIIPLRTLPKLRISFRKKLALSFLFALGTFAMAATVIRCVVALTDDSDSLAKILIWSTVEETVAFLVANGPSLRPLFLRGNDGSSHGTTQFDEPGHTRRRTQHDLYELTPKEHGVVTVVSSNSNQAKNGRDPFPDNAIAVLRTVEVTSGYGKKEDGDGTSSNSSLWMP